MTKMLEDNKDFEWKFVDKEKAMDEMVEGLESTKEMVMTGVDVNPAISGDEKAELQESFDKLIAGSTEIYSGIGDQLESAEGVALKAKNVKLSTHPRINGKAVNRGPELWKWF